MHDDQKNSQIISHMTDIEGNLRYFNQWVQRSRHLQFANGHLSFCDSQSGNKFVYGGDFCDKGPGDLRIGRFLADFKEKQPKDVFLIAGNREIKCRRFSYELLTNIRQRLLYGEAAWWNPQCLPRQYVARQIQSISGHSVSESDIKRFVSGKSVEECQTMYLKWMLAETMGCGSFKNKPNTFEYRRLELADIAKQPLAAISDEEVTASFIDSVSVTGIITSYLKKAHLGSIIGETLFVHGAITPENMGFLPGMSESDRRMSDAREWIEALNDWYAGEVCEWSAKPLEENLHPPGHKPLDRYVVFNPKSIVTSNWYLHGKLGPVDARVVQFLNDAGIYRVVSGHQPFSDFPLIIRQPTLEVIVGDTGYSDPQALADNRGLALHNLSIVQHKNKGYALIDAIRRDGSQMTLSLPSEARVSAGDDNDIGHFTQSGQLIRPVIGGLLSACQLDGFAVVENPVIHRTCVNSR